MATIYVRKIGIMESNNKYIRPTQLAHESVTYVHTKL